MDHAVDKRLQAIEEAVEQVYDAIVEGDKKASERFLTDPFSDYISEGLAGFSDLRQKLTEFRAFLSREQTATRLVQVLNEAFLADAQAMQKLVDHRVRLIGARFWGKHPTLTSLMEGGQMVVGLVGVINGFRLSDDEPRVAAVYRGSYLTGFVLMEKKEEEEEEKEKKGRRVIGRTEKVCG